MRAIASMLSMLVLLCGCNHDTAPGTTIFPPMVDPRPIGLPIPSLSLGVGIESGDWWISWSSIPEAESYALQSDRFANFLTASTIYSGASRQYYLGFKSHYDATSYYRVRAESPYSVSAWSDSIPFP